MIRALLYLRLTSFRNWFLWRVRRLRRPKYLVGAVVGVAYFYFFFFRHALGAGRRGPPGVHAGMAGFNPAAMPDMLATVVAIASLVLLLILVFSWIVPRERAALGFSEAEIAFLFPAPVERRALVHFRLVTSQLRTLVAGLVMALLSNRWTVFGGNAFTHVLGWWFVFSTLNLHHLGSSFAMTRMADRGGNLVLRRLLILGGLLALLFITVWRLPAAERFPGPIDHTVWRYLNAWLVNVSSAAPLSWVLYPVRLVLLPFFAADLRTFLLTLWPALSVVALHYVWVSGTAVAFEEASIASAEKRASRIASWRAGEARNGRKATVARADPFALGGVGRPELAFLWKNLLATSSYFNLRVLGGAAAIIVAGTVWVRSQPAFSAFGQGAASLAAIVGAYLLIVGPQFARQDIRSDLRKLDVLKTYPLPGWQVVLGEVLTPAAILSGIVGLSLLTLALNLPSSGPLQWLTPGVRIAGALAVAGMIPPVVVLQLLVPNSAALIFPSWSEVTQTRGGGPEVMGQRMIFFFAQMVTMVVVMLPAAAMGLLLIWLLQMVLPLPLAIAMTAVPLIAVLTGQVALALWWLGGRFEKLDLSEELRG